MGVEVRTATPADYPSLVHVAREVHEHHVAAVPSVFRSVAVPFPEEYFAQIVGGEDSDVLVAEANGAIAGYASLALRRATLDFQVPRTIAFVNNFGVSRASRRMGVGRALFAACIAWTRERGATNLELDCWEANQEAVHFYDAMGMRLTRRYLALDV